MAEINIGVNLIEILTTGMYKDARTIFREYVQNSCDAIDKAGGGSIEIVINAKDRYICIEDSGCGVDVMKFENTLKNIANSSKSSADNKGFRGIGRLCGLAYCDELKFTSFSHGYTCRMTFDAAKLRDNFYKGSNLSASQMLDEITKTASDYTNKNMRGFKVELFGVNNDELLDADNIMAYLSFVAPVRYSEDFKFAARIHAHASELNFKIDEYDITVNGKAVVKGYANYVMSRSRDELFDVSFKEIRDAAGNLLAWIWIGLRGFNGQLNRNFPARAIRLRKGNIQIGDETALQSFFTEIRGTYYFVGEVFAVDKELIPNSQRDYFVDNNARTNFETAIRNYFSELYKLYHDASEVNSAKRKIDKYKTALDKYKSDGSVGNFVEGFKLKELSDDAKNAQVTINDHTSRKYTSEDLKLVVNYLIPNPGEFKVPLPRIEKTGTPPPFQPTVEKILAQVDSHRFSKRDIGTKILDTIYRNTDAETYKHLVSKILEALK